MGDINETKRGEVGTTELHDAAPEVEPLVRVCLIEGVAFEDHVFVGELEALGGGEFFASRHEFVEVDEKAALAGGEFV